jgi:hypothetical protein
MRTERIIEKESVWLWETEKNEKESKKLIETRPSWVKISSNFFLHISQKAESLSFEKMTLFFSSLFHWRSVFFQESFFFRVCQCCFVDRSDWYLSLPIHNLYFNHGCQYEIYSFPFNLFQFFWFLYCFVFPIIRHAIVLFLIFSSFRFH